MLDKEPSRRLGARGVEEIKTHPYFHGVQWDDVYHFRIQPPFFPVVQGDGDTSNFDVEFTREPPVLTPCHGVLSAVDQDEFRGFTHVSDWAVQERASLLGENNSE